MIPEAVTVFTVDSQSFIYKRSARALEPAPLSKTY